MKKLMVSLGACALIGSSIGSSLSAVELKNDTDKFSYIIAQNMGESMKRQGVDLNVDVFAGSLKDALAGKESQMKPEEMRTFMMAFQKTMMEKMKAQEAVAGKANLEVGKKYLEENKKKDNVKVTMSGLQYTVLKEGTGAIPKATDRVEVHYTGTLIDGTVFDSSVKRGKPAVFPVNGVIKGWTEALQLMKVGSKWDLVVPSEIAYGANPRPGGPIGPNAVLKFTVELLSIKEALPAPKGSAHKMPPAGKK